jgi:hypothetical protein
MMVSEHPSITAPPAPLSLEEAGLSDTQVLALILKNLFTRVASRATSWR